MTNIYHGMTSTPTASGGGGAAPTGTGSIFFGTAATVPSGWLIADGAAVSRSTYAALFTVIGTTYGIGDGATTFNVPNLVGRYPFGKDTAGTGSTLGGTFGTKDHTHDAHTSGSVSLLGLLSSAFTGPGTHSAENPPSLTVNFIIKT